MPHSPEDLLQRLTALESGRGTYNAHCQDLAEIMLPRRADFTTEQVEGAKRTEKQFDGTPMQAARALAASIDGLLKPKTQPWFKIKTDDDALNELDIVKEWLEFAETRVRNAIYSPRARFLQRSAECDLDLVVFGTGVLYVGDDPAQSRLLFRCYHLREIYLCENEKGDIDTVFRKFKLTARQAVQKFGKDKAGKKASDALQANKPDEKIEYVHIVMPRDDPGYGYLDNRPPKMQMPWASLWIERAEKRVIGEGGFLELPYVIPRWDTAADEVYGRSPGMIALPDAASLQQIGKTLLKAGQKAVDPPLFVPSEGMKSPRRTRPGGQTYYDVSLMQRTGGRPPVFPMETGANIPLGREMQNDIRIQVQRAFFNDLMRLPVDGPQMTATEILERKEEYVRVLGPVFGRLEADYTGATIDRVWAILARAGVFGAPETIPEELQGRNVRFEFTSPIARAVRKIEAAAVSKSFQEVLPMAELKPDVMDNFDEDAIARGVADANGVPQKWMRPVREVMAIRDERAKAQAQAQMAASLMEMGTAAVPIATAKIQADATKKAA